MRRSISRVVAAAAGLSRADFWALGEIACERHLWGVVGDASERVADDEFGAHQFEPAHHGVGGVEHLAETGTRAAAHRRERLGEPCAGDQVVG